MIPDPAGDPDGRPPYELLACVGLTPETSHALVQDASFELLSRRLLTPERNLAWDELRVLRRRMLVDFFLYDIDPSEELDGAARSLRTALSALEAADVAELRRLDPAMLLELAGQEEDGSAASVRLPAVSDVPPIPEEIPLFEFDR
jgi:hypothetical protein